MNFEESEQIKPSFLADAVSNPGDISTTTKIDESLVENATIATEESTNKNSDSKIRTAEIKKVVSYCFEYPAENKYTDKQRHCTLCKGRYHSSSNCRKMLKHLGLPWSCNYFTLFIATDEERVSTIQAEEQPCAPQGAQMKSIVNDIFSMEDRPPFSNTFLLKVADHDKDGRSKFEINVSKNNFIMYGIGKWKLQNNNRDEEFQHATGKNIDRIDVVAIIIVVVALTFLHLNEVA